LIEDSFLSEEAATNEVCDCLAERGQVQVPPARQPCRSRASTPAGFGPYLRFPQRLNLFQGAREASAVAFLFDPDLLRRVLAYEAAFGSSSNVSYRCKTFIQVLPDSDGHREAPALVDW
jgi:hypothetical protein